MRAKKKFLSLVVAGWGTTENDTSSDKLLQLFLEYKKSAVCESEFQSQVCYKGSLNSERTLKICQITTYPKLLDPLQVCMALKINL